MTNSLLAFLAGVLAWTLLEYLLHRFVFHGASADRMGAREHRRHHALGDYFAPWTHKAAAALVAIAIVLPASMLLAGVAAGACGTLGFISMYLLYEILHRRAHVRPPGGYYGRWRRKNHFAHHFVDPRRAHGVTTPLWDWVFGTRLRVDRVRVPRRLAMPWLLDAEGEVLPAYASDYFLVGSVKKNADTRQQDTAASENHRLCASRRLRFPCK